MAHKADKLFSHESFTYTIAPQLSWTHFTSIVGTLFVPNFWELLERFKEKHLNRLFNGASNAAPTPQPAYPAKTATPDNDTANQKEESEQKTDKTV